MLPGKSCAPSQVFVFTVCENYIASEKKLISLVPPPRDLGSQWEPTGLELASARSPLRQIPVRPLDPPVVDGNSSCTALYAPHSTSHNHRIMPTQNILKNYING